MGFTWSLKTINRTCPTTTAFSNSNLTATIATGRWEVSYRSLRRSRDNVSSAINDFVVPALYAVLNDKIVVHGSGLLNAVRQVYNVFLLSKSSANQQVAQGTLTQMVGTVFERVKTRIHMKEARLNLGKLGTGAANTSSFTVD